MNAGDDTWKHYAACKGADPAPWFPDTDQHNSIAATREARTYCDRCPCRLACVKAAIANDERDGIWGGVLFSGRSRDDVKRRIVRSYPQLADELRVTPIVEPRPTQIRMPPNHGTNSRYTKHACRCEPCTDAHARYMSGYRFAYQHGKPERYKTCVCSVCRAAFIAARREQAS